MEQKTISNHCDIPMAELITAYHYEKDLLPAMKRRDIEVAKMHKRLKYEEHTWEADYGDGLQTYTEMRPPRKTETYYNDLAKRGLSNTTIASIIYRDEHNGMTEKEVGYDFVWNPIVCMATSTFMWTHTIPLFLLIIMAERWFYA